MLHRRDFIQSISILSAFLLLCLNSCKRALLLPSEYGITPKQFHSLESIHNHLFPDDISSPGAIDFNSVGYIKKILKDPQIENSEKKFILAGINLTEEKSTVMFHKNFSELSNDQKESVLLEISKTRKGEIWISKNITFILEALLSDPIYGSNTEEIGWKWLKHKSGSPRPNIYTKYQYL